MLKDLTKGKEEAPSFTKWVTKLTDKIFNSDGDECVKRGKLSWQQMQVLKSLQENKYNIIKGYRCAGLSTMLRLNMLYNLLYKETNDDYHALFILDSQRAAEYEKRMFLQLLVDSDEYIVMTKNNKNEIELLFDGRKVIIEFISQNQLIDRMRKEEKINQIDIDNAAFILDKNTSDSIAVLAKQTNANVSLVSVPNGEKGLFYDTWRDSKAGTAPFKMSSLKWYLDDRFNEGLKGSTGLESYNIDNIGMLFEALENHDMITNKWHDEKEALLGSSIAREVDGEFV